ncbi:REV1 [Candida metapsilosis]|uniref:DNA repair protein REV1 n=1 Tax=Candida metapsilosis TaxID=273372 RepID=A0A8H7ZHM6_9ASCO|nr:REV1 [Candida metapsilosis]
MKNDQIKHKQPVKDDHMDNDNDNDNDDPELNQSQYSTFLKSLNDETLLSHINRITQSQQSQKNISFQEASTPKPSGIIFSSASTDPFNDGLDEEVLQLDVNEQDSVQTFDKGDNLEAPTAAGDAPNQPGAMDDDESSESEKDESAIGKLHEFGDYRTYFDSKRMKQQRQDEAYVKWDTERRKAQNETSQPLPIFSGCTIFVNGHTKPSINEIHRLVILHGGKFISYLSNKSSASHIICDRLTPRKNLMFKNCRVVKAQWIVDCVDAKELLDWQQYRLILDVAFDQKRLDFPSGSSKEEGGKVDDQDDKDIGAPVEAAEEADLEGMEDDDDFESTLLPEEDDVLQKSQQYEQEVDDQDKEDENLDDDIPEFKVATPTTITTKGVHQVKGKIVLDARHPDFLAGFFANSRLHHLSMWKADLRLKFLRRIIKENLHKPIADPFRDDKVNSKVIMHIDFDCFFATASCLKHPNLDINKDPIAVGHGGNTSDVASCNYVARKFGVRNGMWFRSAQKLCPGLILLDYEFEAYEKYSSEFYNYLVSSDYFDTIFPVSIDEVLVDATSYCNKPENGGVERAVEELSSLIRKHVYQLTNCTVSVGSASNVLLAKLALRKAKPRGQYALFNDTESFLPSVSIKDLPGFGGGILEKLEPEISKPSPKIEDILPISNTRLIQLLGEKTGTKLFQYARGIDHTSIEIDTSNPEVVLGRKSISVDVNFGIRFDSVEELDDFFMRLAKELYQRMINLGVCGSTLTLKLAKRRAGASVVTAKFLGLGEVDFINKSSRLGMATNDWGVIGSEIKVLYRMVNIPVKDLRGISVSMTRLKDAESIKSSKQMKLPFGAVGRVPSPSKEVGTSNEGSPSKDVFKTPKKASNSKVTLEQLSFSPRRKSTTPKLDPFSDGQQIDWEVFESLPLDIPRELEGELKRRGFLKERSPGKGKAYLQQLIPTQGGTAKYVRVVESPTKSPPKRKSTPVASPIKRPKQEPLYEDSQSYDSSLLNQLPSSIKADVLKDLEYKQKIKKFDLVPLRDKVTRKIQEAKVEVKEITEQWIHQQPKLFELPSFLNDQVTASELRQKVKDWVNTSLSQGGPHEDDVLYFATYLQTLLDKRLFSKAVMLIRDILNLLKFHKTINNCADDDDNQLMFSMIGIDDWQKQIDSVLKPELTRPRDEIDKQSENYKQIRDAISDEFEDLDDCEDEVPDPANEQKFGLEFDCYPFPFMRHYVNLTAASTIQLARKLVNSTKESDSARPIGINWYGGRHHCHRAKCSGFCYINDVVLGITTIRKMCSGNVFYLDLDLHDGDGVAEAFKFSKKVTTCSVHRQEVGFFPGMFGNVDASVVGMYNVPTLRGLSDWKMLWILENIVYDLIAKSKPDYFVVQLGCDGLASDPNKQWNMTIGGYVKVVKFLMENIKVPIMFLGGGGYNHTEVAKCWTAVTATILGHNVDKFDEVPDHEKLDDYEDDGYMFWTDSNSHPSKMKDENDMSFLSSIMSTLKYL